MSHAEEDRQKGNCRHLSQTSELLLYSPGTFSKGKNRFSGHISWVWLDPAHHRWVAGGRDSECPFLVSYPFISLFFMVGPGHTLLLLQGVPMAVRMALLAPESPTLCAFFGLFQPRLKSPTGHPSAPGLRPDLPRFGSTAVTQNQQNWSCWPFPSTVPTQGPCLSLFPCCLSPMPDMSSPMTGNPH